MINCKVELKLKWKNHCLLPPNGNDNDGVHSNNIIFTIKEIVKDSKLGKDLTEQFIGINIKQKVRIKIRQMKIDILKGKMLKGIKPEDIIYEKVLLRIVMSS